MYLFISENEVQAYNGEILKRYVGRRLVKTIANPTDEDLKEFGYMELVEGEAPDFDAETQYVVSHYRVGDGKIYFEHRVEELPKEIDLEYPMEENDEVEGV